MTLQEYAAIATACDRLLRSPDADLARLAVPLLHVVKEHPGTLQQYEPALHASTAGASRSAQSPWVKRLDTARAATRALSRSVRESAARLLRRQPPSHVDVLIVSHLTNPAQLRGDGDAYFGSLQRSLQARGVSCILLLIDHLRDEVARREYAAQVPSGQRELLSRAVPVAAELGIWWQCLRSRRRLRREALGSSDPMVRALGLLACRDMLQGQTLANLRLHKTLARRCARLTPAILITTHEGDACERVIWHAARTTERPPLCVGYQHALLPQHAHAIRRCIGGASGAPGAADPDVILTSGQIPHAALAASPQLRPVRLIEYGSHRHAQPAADRSWLERRRQCLVLPDAQEAESIMLFNFALACAQHRPDMTFVLRPHPIIDFSDLARLHSNLRGLPQNVRISSDDLAHDCSEARYCLYRGSSAVLQAVRFGAKPLYLARPEEIAFDPLFTLREWRATVGSPEEFVRCVLQAEAAPDPQAAQRAADECARYISAVQPAAIDELLALSASRHRGQPLERDVGNLVA